MPKNEKSMKRYAIGYSGYVTNEGVKDEAVMVQVSEREATPVME